MEQQEMKKDTDSIKVNKNMIICVLAVALVIVSLVAICSSFRGGYRDRYEYGPRMMGGYGAYGGRMMNYGYGQGIPVSGDVKIIPPTGGSPTTTPATPPKAQ